MRIARFLHRQQVIYGELLSGNTARRLEGSPVDGWRSTSDVVTVDRLLAPVEPRIIFGIGLNYRDHAIETKALIPEHPVLFIKCPNTLNDPMTPVVLPANSEQVDYEGELAVYIHRRCRNVTEEDALQYVAGYTVANDITARDWQKNPKLGGGQWTRGKSFDGFCPVGPLLITPEDVPDPQALTIRTIVSGEVMQQSSTSEMIFPVRKLIHLLSQTMTILPGTLILTGTPAGVGMARTPQRFLRAGDVVVIEISGIGKLETPIVMRA